MKFNMSKYSFIETQAYLLMYCYDRFCITVAKLRSCNRNLLSGLTEKSWLISDLRHGNCKEKQWSFQDEKLPLESDYFANRFQIQLIEFKTNKQNIKLLMCILLCV